jgi:hypothetical protein
VFNSEPTEALGGSQLCELEIVPVRTYKMDSSEFTRSDLCDSIGEVG